MNINKDMYLHCLVIELILLRLFLYSNVIQVNHTMKVTQIINIMIFVINDIYYLNRLNALLHNLR